ncbi:alpha/beta fold hydrolase [Streptomyces flavofungini]|uniref:Alpha/beta hydrolase n=1 Tax=Streptomyces flavofungini TaxID=68200 RepID=A0ABS0XD32_9ACTN|nr:alpha/beta hydrolase [Streptomyces flavofungini]MBJ3811128.1 alpha/beta hydrolase [Streptomyces flavofungini]MBJ3813256.1 alpha/beta hydrolase [Streptomyces flavofungini]GHC67824.1 hydrolase [Streptomyces flavofungini]
METTVAVDGGEVWARDEGDPAGPGLPLVLLHPGIGDSRIWDGVVPALTGRRRVIRYDARGFGRSPTPTTSYSQRRDALAVLDRFGIERAVLAASSMGGATSLSVALAEPDRVAGLALIAPGVTGASGLKPPEVMVEIEQLAKAGDMDGLVAMALRLWASADPAPDGAPARQLRGAIPAWFTTYAHDVADPPAYDRLGEVAAPCVLALCERDQPAVIAVNEEMAARIPDCRLVRLADCDHFPTLREPGTVARLIGELCAQVDPPG